MTNPKLEQQATAALVAYYADIIRNEIGEDPDHSGPEDAADMLAGMVMSHGYERLLMGDWKDLLA